MRIRWNESFQAREKLLKLFGGRGERVLEKLRPVSVLYSKNSRKGIKKKTNLSGNSSILHEEN